ncbi:60S ribosomal protein L38 [Aspergillus udagawae]|uniref:60S ribosomal protein L38 n=1 Tax=Aspergillus udagawae TaxID=91492 RepID=A0ABQ1A8N8_9EURO|nr:60S ribosomal protein L38 [Aspergillus udagawae]GFF76207.1 60S ribosomal protein L38 [Aspergillus udagawae]GFG03508.1 60S ribosomal protein L38 [Aspergillus udagawae]GFG20263.1 60S ribosomal protein L38 [Aspergillus udagawae]
MPPQPPKGTDPAFEWFDTLLRAGLAFSVLTFLIILFSTSVKLVAFWRRNRVRVHLSKKDPRSRNGIELGDVPYTTAPFPHGFAPSRADAASVIHHPNPIYRDASRVTDNIAPGIVPWQWRQHQPQEEERL